ncbi:amidohydrolase family protein [Litoribacter alkaliphilus]|uniref:Amidohydrolase family protein n=1 Tax=Litoribacter ruber TaxID=702568 RepID=A0AAP2G367_9BACT|nr:amidohydrolase family protein [Litoribacter alkaliphilus]MBS9523145.1 amidohydrolase family protein [Litoribacter alkaliphilus]
MYKSGFGRREFLKGMGLVSLMPLGMVKALGNQLQGQFTSNSFLIINAQIISMDKSVGNLKRGDVLIENGQISRIGNGLTSEKEVEVIDAKGKVLLPGFVETHWHIWTGLFRSMSVKPPGNGYFETQQEVGPHFTPDDMKVACELAGAEAIDSGITTLHNWCHNVRSFEHAVASLEGVEASGVRARYSFGNAVGRGSEEAIDFAPLEKLKADWDNYNNSGLFDLGFAWRGIEGNIEIGTYDYQRASELGLPITTHASREGVIARLSKAGFLNEKLQLIHGMQATDWEIEAMVDAGSSISISPFSELRIGYGFPEMLKLLDKGATIGLSVDTTTISGNADMFAIMKNILNITNAMAQDEFQIGAERVLEMATIEGARSLGIGDRVGSITPGKQADLILIDPNALNLAPFTSAVDILVEAGQPRNVSMVMVNGEILKKDGRLQKQDAQDIVNKANSAFERIKSKV